MYLKRIYISTTLLAFFMLTTPWSALAQDEQVFHTNPLLLMCDHGVFILSENFPTQNDRGEEYARKSERESEEKEEEDERRDQGDETGKLRRKRIRQRGKKYIRIAPRQCCQFYVFMGERLIGAFASSAGGCLANDFTRLCFSRAPIGCGVTSL